VDGVATASLARRGGHVVTLFSPQCRECIHCRSDRTNLCLAIREQQNQGYLRTERRGCRARRADAPLHGNVDVADTR